MFTKIEHTFWTDRETRNLSINAKLVFLYVLSCKHRNILGFYILPSNYAAYDLNLEPKQFEKALAELIEVDSLCFDPTNDIVLINNFLKYNPLESPTQIVSAIKNLVEIPATFLFQDLIDVVQKYKKADITTLLASIQYRIDTLPDTLCHTLSDTPCDTSIRRSRRRSINKNRSSSITPDGDNASDSGEQEQEKIEQRKTEPKQPRISDELQAIIDKYNLTELPKARIINEKRIKNLNSLLKKYGTEQINIAIDKAAQSDFLNGRTEKPFNGCDFDWIFNETNFVKIIEGKYDNDRYRRELPKSLASLQQAVIDHNRKQQSGNETGGIW